MKTIIQRVFARGARHAPLGHSVSSELTHTDIENYYLKVISECLRRLLVPADSLEIAVRRSGTAPNGLAAFSAYVRLRRWDPVMSPVLLQNAPVIDARIRKVVHASVLLEHTHFAGIWFQATADTEGAPRTLVGMPAELIHQPGGPPSI